MAELAINGDVFDAGVEEQATKPALVRYNALGAVLATWKPQRAALRRYFRVVRYRKKTTTLQLAARKKMAVGPSKRKPAGTSTAKPPATRRKPPAGPRCPRGRGRS